jgi:hypothetical protein
MLRLSVRKGVVLVTCALLATPWNAYPYGTITHAAISNNAYGAAGNVQSNFFGALNIDPQATFGTHTARGWVIAGSQYEDDEPLPTTDLPSFIPSGLPMRPLFHFFDPYNNKGLDVGPITQTSTSVQWGLSGFGQSLLVGLPLTSDNDFPYGSLTPMQGARFHFYNGLTEPAPGDRSTEIGMTFRSLGQVIHLLQDAAQPQHVRNDWHLDLGSVDLTRYSILGQSLGQLAVPLVESPSAYERYVDGNPGLQNLPSTGVPVVFSIPDQFFQGGGGLATFTNRNFVSAGTNCTNATTCGSVGGYPLPSITGQSQGPVVDVIYGGNLQQCQAAFPVAVCQSFITEFTNQFIDPLTGNTITNGRMTTRSIFDFDLMSIGLPPFFSLASFNYASQATILIPKAVDYSAGLLNYFFRGSLSAQTASGGGIAVTNTSAENMTGTFSLYYDDANGTRYPVQGASWQLTIPAGGTSAPQTFTPPASPTPRTPGLYVLVFQGTLGAEAGAVAGAAVTTLIPSLTIVKIGSGSGTVTSVPPGINCGVGQTACSASFPTGTLLTLTATPGSGSTFVNMFCQGEPNLPPSSNPLSLNLTANVTCTAVFGIATSASVLTVSCDQIAKNSVEFTASIHATGALSGPTGFSARIQEAAGPPAIFSNLYDFIGAPQISSLDCGAWSSDPAQGTCTRFNSQPQETTWTAAATQPWDSIFPNPPPLNGGAVVLITGGNVALAGRGITCTIK